jgi:SAM-dependent MidA family methyltransferase
MLRLVERRGTVLNEWLVGLDEAGALTLVLGEASTPALAARFEALGVQPGDGARAEVCLDAPELMRAMVRRLERGYVISIDYGHDATALYAGWRRMGTLMAYRSHSPRPDPLVAPGLLDLTAHVDLTSIALAAREEGCEVPPHVSQAEALVGLGIGEAMRAAQERAGADFAAYANARRAAETLMDPTGLGRIRVLVAAKGTSSDLVCLSAALR